MERGNGRQKVDEISPFHEFCEKRKSIVQVKNTEDNLCLARALVIGMALAHKDDSIAKLNYYRHITRPDREIQKLEAERLCAEAAVVLSNGGGIEEVKLFQEYLDNYTITVFMDRRGREIMFEGPTEGKRRNIDLIYGENLFNVIASLTGVFQTVYYCRPCKEPYSHKDKHFCAQACSACQHSPICEEEQPQTCSVCNRIFKSKTCYANHFKPKYEKKKSTCDVLRFCSECSTVYNTLRRKGTHVCGEKYCVTCEEYRPSGHFYYMKQDTVKTKPTDAKFMYIFFDFECSQENQFNNQSNCFEHTPNYCVAQQVCYKCVENDDINTDCEVCGKRQRVFSGEKTLEDFMAYLCKSRPSFSKIVALAHNLKSYDGQFVLKHMVEKFKWVPEVIMSGSKIQVITYKNIKVIDSLNFFNTKLSSLPKMFDLNCSSKGHFPHYFNKKANWGYVGPLPPPADYGCDHMKGDERKEFYDWYNEELEKNTSFNFNEELDRYCTQDVNILRLA